MTDVNRNSNTKLSVKLIKNKFVIDNAGSFQQKELGTGVWSCRRFNDVNVKC